MNFLYLPVTHKLHILDIDVLFHVYPRGYKIDFLVKNSFQNLFSTKKVNRYKDLLKFMKTSILMVFRHSCRTMSGFYSIIIKLTYSFGPVTKKKSIKYN